MTGLACCCRGFLGTVDFPPLPLFGVERVDNSGVTGGDWPRGKMGSERD